MDKLDLILQKMDVMQTDIGQLKTEVAGLKDDVVCLKDDVVCLKNDVVSLKDDVVRIESGLRETNERLQRLESHVEEGFANIHLRMDNEISFGLKVVADGHADLGRKLDEALDQRYTKEQMYVRMIHLSSEIERIKRNCKHCA